MKYAKRRKSGILVLLCMSLILSLLPIYPVSIIEAAGAPAEKRFINSFSDGKTDGWSLSGSKWSVAQSTYGPGGAAVPVLKQSTNSNTPEFALVGNNTWADYTAKLTIKPQNTSLNGGGNAVLFRAADTKNFYWLRFWKNGGKTYLQLFKSVNGTLSNIGQKEYPWADDAWYQVDILTSGGLVKVSVNGENQFSYTNSNAGELVSGGIGFRTYLSELEIARVEVVGNFDLPPKDLGLTALAGDQGIQLNWNEVAETEVSAYRVSRYKKAADGSQTDYTVLAVVPQALRAQGYLDEEELDEATYYYSIEALDEQTAVISQSLEAAINVANEPDSEALFIDSFSDGEADGWRLGSGSWGVAQVGDAPGGASYVLSQSLNSSATEYAFIGDRTWTDYSANVVMRPMNTTPGGSSALLFRATDDKNNYMFRFVKTTSNATIVQLFKYVDGKLSNLAEKSYSWTDGTWYSLQISASGNRIKIDIDNQSVIDFTDSSGPLLTGGIGLRTYLGELQVDRVTVKGNLVQPEQNYGLNAILNGDQQVELKWKASSEQEADRYKVYRGEKNNATGAIDFSPIGEELIGTSYTDSDILLDRTYYYYIEVLNAQLKAISRSFPAQLTTTKLQVLAELANDRIKMDFVQSDIEGQPVITKRTYLADGNGNWVLMPTNSTDEKYAVIFADNVVLGKKQVDSSNKQTHPTWTTPDQKVETNLFQAGSTQWVRPTELSVQGDQVVLTAGRPGEFQLSWKWMLPETGWPVVEQTFVPEKEGQWSVVSEEFWRKQSHEVNNIQLGYLINSKRVPSEPFVFPEYQLPVPVSLVELQVEGLGKVNVGLAPSASEIPDRMAKLENSRFGLLVTSPDGGIQPGLTAPLLGTDESRLAAGQAFTFKYHYIVESGSWSDVYEKVARNIFGFRDYRTSWQTSLTDTIHNMIDLMMDDDYSGWWDRAKGFKDIEILNSVKLANSLAAMEAYLLTGDEEIYKKRALPILEFLVSRSGKVFSPIESKKGPGATSELGGAAYGAATLLPFYEMLKGSTGILYEKAMQDLQSGTRAGIQDQLAAYRTTKDAKYLNEAKRSADKIITTQINSVQTSYTSGTEFVFINWPDWESLIDVYEITGEQKYLDAAQSAADLFLTSVWMQPVPDANQTTAVPNGPIPRSPYVFWTGERLGWPYNPEDLVQSVNSWIPSQAGLTLEQPVTYEDVGGNGQIMNPAWASYLLRLAQYTGKDLYKDVARSSIVGRYSNYPGYYYKQYGITQMDPLYPYQGPDITDIYYHHIPVQLGLTVDFLINDMMYRSQNGIAFEGELDPGLSVGTNTFLWFRSSSYGHKQGNVYGYEGMQLWLPKGLVHTSTPQVSWVGATNGSTLAIPLLNYDSQSTQVTVDIDADMIGGEANQSVRILSEAGDEIETLPMVNGRVELSIPAKGMRTLIIGDVNVSLPSLQWQGNGLQPEEQKASYAKDETQIAQLGNIEGSLIIHNDTSYDAFVYTNVKDSVISEAILHYNDGGQWKTERKSQYPFEFSIGPIRQEVPFQYVLETRTASGEVFSSQAKTLYVTDSAAWQQARLHQLMQQASSLAAASSAIRDALSAEDLATLGGKLQQVLNTVDLQAEQMNEWLADRQELNDLLQWIESRLQQQSDDAKRLFEAVRLAGNLIQGRIDAATLIRAQQAASEDRSVFQGEDKSVTIHIANPSSMILENGQLSFSLPADWSLTEESDLTVPALLPGQAYEKTVVFHSRSTVPVGTTILPFVFHYEVNGVKLANNAHLNIDVKSKLHIQLEAYSATLLAGEPRPLSVELTNEGSSPLDGKLEIHVPDKWKVEGTLEFDNLEAGGSIEKQLVVTPGLDAKTGDNDITIRATGDMASSPEILWKASLTHNVALSVLGSTTKASSELSELYPAVKAIDGGYSSPQVERWVSVDKGPHSLVIDFGKPRSIGQVVVRHMGVSGDPAMNTSDFQIQTGSSADGPWTDLVEPVKGNKLSVTSHSFPAISTQYIRLYITKGSSIDDYARIFEVEAYLAGGEGGPETPGNPNEPETNEPGTNEPGTNEPGTNEPEPNEPETEVPNSPGQSAAPENRTTVMVNGLPYDNLATANKSTVNNKLITTVTVDEKRLNEMLKSGLAGRSLSIRIDNATDTVIGAFSGSTIKSLETGSITLELQTEKAIYKLPAQLLNVDALCAELGPNVAPADITLRVEIALVSDDRAIRDRMADSDIQLISPVVDFKVTAAHGDKETQVENFAAYVERWIVIPDDADASRATTAVSIGSDARFNPVPTQIVQLDGKRYAAIKSLTNSVYAVIHHEKAFADSKGNWAQASIENMASRLVVNGVNAEQYLPQKDITRAEFAAIVIRALGLRAADQGYDFADVQEGDWYAQTIQTAHRYQLLKGYADGAIRPNQSITREEAMVILAQAIRLAVLDTGMTASETEQLLSSFSDTGNISSWARTSAALNVKHGIIQGYNDALSPKQNITRAETAKVVETLLGATGLIASK